MPIIPEIVISKLSQTIANMYTIDNNTFIIKDTGDTHNKYELEVGDIFSENFQPQIKLKRWDNECNFSVRLLDNDVSFPVIETVDDKIKFVKNKSEAHFYNIPKNEVNPDYYEFEVILNEKPDNNKVEMSIETKGLKFCYQPPLTQDEIDEGYSRPENVIGSYAVYHNTKQGDFHLVGGQNYMTGKAFHIYRPKIIDNNGKEVWGKLNITDNLLTVEIPQDFLDNASYPVRHAAGLTFGFTSTGASWYGAAGRCFSAHSTSSFPGGTITQIHSYMRNNDGVNNHVARLGMYDYSGNVPVNLECQTNELEVTAGSTGMWVEGNTTTNPNLPSGEYALAHIYYDGGAADVQHNYDTGNLGDWDSDDGLGSTTVLPDPFVADSGGANNLPSIYCTYTPPPVGAIMNQFQRANIGADLYNGVFA